VAVPLAAPRQSTASGAADDLPAQLALRVAAAIVPAVELRLDASGDAALQRELTMRLQERGVRTVSGNAAVPFVRAACSDNLRERACSAEIEIPAGGARPTGTRYVVVVTRPHEVVARADVPLPTLQTRPLVTSAAPVLDVATAGDRLLVLTPSALVAHEETDGEWRAVASRPVSTLRAWPRDVRGRLRVSGGRVEAFLPGVLCAGRVADAAWSCSEGGQAWPLDVDGASLAPGRNYFTVAVGPPFFGIANVSGEVGTRWAAVTLDRRLVFIGERGQVSATTIVADDIVALRPPCTVEPHVLITARAGNRDGDVATLYRIADRQAETAAKPVVLPGNVTALWPSFDVESALVVTHDTAAGRYEAQQISVRCDR
jgi:hypothetical protein